MCENLRPVGWRPPFPPQGCRRNASPWDQASLRAHEHLLDSRQVQRHRKGLATENWARREQMISPKLLFLTWEMDENTWQLLRVRGDRVGHMPPGRGGSRRSPWPVLRPAWAHGGCHPAPRPTSCTERASCSPGPANFRLWMCL